MRSRAVSSALGVSLLAGVVLASACATSSGSMARGSRLDARPTNESPSARRYSREESDSILAQAFADREGPRVEVRALLTNISSSRRMRASFRVEDDAYVVIGHVDPDGNVRIVFPTDPRDDGFVKGQRSYQTSEFFAGFTDQYRYRYQYTGFRGFHPDAYDGGFGYVFIVASWRPMHFEKFSNEYGWDNFELTDASYMYDPRPAIYELASLLAGENREAYTVKFAKYYNTLNWSPYSQAGYFGLNGMRSCAGFSSLGWGMTPFIMTYYNPLYTYGNDFYYRGQYYMYNGASDCYYTQPQIYNRGPIVWNGSPPGGVPSRPRSLAAEDAHRKPGEPIPARPRILVTPGDQASDASEHLAQRASPRYRDRGLITTDDGSDVPPRGRAPRVSTDEPTRPSIQQMVERRTSNGNDGSGWTRSRIRTDDDPQPTPRDGWARPTGRVNGGNVGSNDGTSEPRTSRPQPVDREPRQVSQPAPRYEPPPRVETPRSEPVSRPVVSPPSSPPSEPPASSKPVKPPV